MSSALFYMVLGVLIWLLGLLGLLLMRHMLRRIIAINIMGSGVFLVMVARASLSTPKDPVLQALVVTGLVVAISATAYALRLAQHQAEYDRRRRREGRPR